MNHEFDERDAQAPLDLARQLEQAGPTSCGDSGIDMPTDFHAAQAGLDLIRRAVVRDKQKVAVSQLALEDVATPNKQFGDTNLNSFRSASISEAAPSRMLGRFEIIRELGRGGFGIVLLARDPTLDRLVALKAPKADFLLDQEGRERFEREARLGSLLSHPAIVPIYESSSEGPVSFIAFAWCQGTSLSHWFQQQDRQIEIDLAARIVARLANAVQYAHRRGVIHRDLKPANVLLDLPDEDNDPDTETMIAALRITDFGLAKSTLLDDCELTRDGAIVGTPMYMAPEQASGRLESVGAAADIYSLGVILYELLTGEPPFRRETDLATLAAVETEPAAPLRRRRREIPADLDAVCLKCLEKPVSLRYPSAFELQQDLENFLAGRPVQARRITQLERGLRWAGRNPAIAAALSLALIGLVISLWQWRCAEGNWRQAQVHLSQVAAQRARALRNLDRTEVAIDRMLNDVAETLKQIPRLETLRTSLLQQALALQQELVSDQADDPHVRFRSAQSWRRMGEIFLMLGDYHQAQSSLESACRELDRVDTASVMTESLHAEQAKIAMKRAQVLSRTDNRDEAEREARAAIAALAENERIENDVSLLNKQVDAYWLLGKVLESNGKIDEAVAACQEALALIQSLSPEELEVSFRIQQGQILNSLGVLHNRLNLADQAESFFLRSIETLEPVAAERPERIDLEYNVAITSINLGNRFSRKQDHKCAVEFYMRAYRIFEGLAKSFPDVVNYRENLVRAGSGFGLSQLRTVDARTGAQTLMEAIENQRLLPDQVRETVAAREELAILYNNLGNCELELPGDLVKAAQAYADSYQIYDQLRAAHRTSARYQRLLSASLGNSGSVAFKKGELVAALNCFERSIAEAEQACNLDRNDTAAQVNAAWQLNKLCETCLALRDFNSLTAHVQR